MKYVMVTDLDKHWDKIEGNFTSYSPKIIRLHSRTEKLVSGTGTWRLRFAPPKFSSMRRPVSRNTCLPRNKRARGIGEN